MGIEEVTVYAFSIENFKRPQDEVDGLFSLAEEKFEKLLQEKDKIQEQGVKIRIFGQTKLLPNSLQKLLSEVEQLTKNNSRVYLNVCFAYTSRQEITSAMNSIIKAKVDDKMITEDVLQSFFWSHDSPDPNLLVRTSGESRLSDFMLWQSSFSVICFVEKLWPEFSIWDLFKAVFFYQHYSSSVTKAKTRLKCSESMQIHDQTQETFQKSLHSNSSNGEVTKSGDANYFE